MTPQGKPGEPSNRPMWPLVAAVGIAASVLGYLLGAAGNTGRDPVGPDAEPATTGVSPEGSAPGAEGPPTSATLSDLVPGLHGTLIAQAGGSGPYQDLVFWSSGWTASRSSRIGPGGPLLLDADGDLMARLSRAAAEVEAGDSALFVGPTRAGDTLVPLALEVRSFAWHATEPGRIALMEAVGEPSGADLPLGFESWEQRFLEPRDLHLGEVRANGSATIDPPIARLPGAELLAWGDWGLALMTYDVDTETPNVTGILVVLDTDGTERWRARSVGQPLAASGKGLLLLATDLPRGVFQIVAADTGTELGTVEQEGALPWAAFSPDGERLALLVGRADSSWLIAIWSVADMAWEDTVALPGAYYQVSFGPGIRWSPDARFILLPGQLTVAGPFGITFYDTVDGVSHHVDIGPIVHAAFLRQ